MNARWGGLSQGAKKAHRFVLSAYLNHGREPDKAELKEALGLDAIRMDVVLADLNKRDLIVMDRDNIIAAYPFSTKNTRLSVTINGSEIPAICAIDALGTSAMAGTSAKVKSSCTVCEASIAVNVTEEGLGHKVAIHRLLQSFGRVWARLTAALRITSPFQTEVSGSLKTCRARKTRCFCCR